MLVQFSVKNFKTFKDKASLSLIASNYDKETREEDNISNEEKFGLRLLKSAVVYGANASGKSKLLDAFAFTRYFVINSSKETQKGDRIRIVPFRLNDETINEPSEFEVIFIHNQVLYRYGFEVTNQKIISEWLFHKPNTKEVELFYREGDQYKIHARNFSKGNTVVKEGLVRENALLISVAAQFNEPISNLVLSWFSEFEMISGLKEHNFKNNTINKIKNDKEKVKILEFLKAADLGIQDINYEEVLFPDDLPDELKSKLKELQKDMKQIDPEAFSDISTTHNVHNSDKSVVSKTKFSVTSEESNGTRKFLYLSGTIMDVLEKGGILIADELDSKLHPNLVCKIVSLFNSKEANKNNAQLIFNTHDTNLLSSGLFRRDQIWFTNKNKYGEASLYSLSDFKSDEVRKTDPFEENYINGKYGAVPYLGFFDNLTNLLSQHENEKQKR